MPITQGFFSYLPSVLFTAGFRLMADRMASLRSNQWSCSELAKGAEIAADLAFLSLKVNASSLSREDLLKSIQDRSSYIP